MAVLLNNPNNQQNQEDEPNQPINYGGQDQSSMGGAGASQAGAGQPQQRASGRFTNLQKYINANQGAGAQIGQRIENTAKKTVNTQDESNRLSDIRQAVQGEQNRIGQAGQYAQQLGQQGGAEQLAGQNLDQFTQLRTGQTNLPQLQEQANQFLSNAQTSAQNLGDIAKQSQSEAGRFNLLRQSVGGPSYNTGQRRLDQLLLQGQGNSALGALQQNLNTQAQNRQQQVAGYGQEINPNLQNIQTGAQTAQQQLQQALGKFGTQAGFGEESSGALGDIYKQLADRQVQAKIQQDAAVQNAQQNIDAGNLSKLTPETLNLLGLKSGTRVYNTNLADYSKYINAGDTDITQADIISPEQQSRLNALQQLSGINPQEIQLGQKYGQVGATFDPAVQSQFQKDLNQKETDFQNWAKTQQTVSPDGNVVFKATPDQILKSGLGQISYDTGNALGITQEGADYYKQQLYNQIMAQIGQRGYNNIVGSSDTPRTVLATPTKGYGK